MTARRVLSALLVVALLAACSPAHRREAPEAAAQRSAWEQTLDRIGPDGRVDLPTALAAFALAVGPVPGAAPPAGRREPLVSGSLAVAWILAHWPELDAPQRAAVRAALDVPPATRAPAALHVGTPAVAPTPTPAPADPDLPCLTADSADAAPYRAMFADVEADIHAHLGRGLSIKDKVFFSVNTRDLEQPSMLYTFACSGTQVTKAKPGKPGKVPGCTIHVNPKVHNGPFSPKELYSFLVHEVMHCFLYDGFGTEYDKMPAWYVEGPPTWAMEVLGTSSFRLGEIWQSYLDGPAKPLARRDYDGLGFFVHLAETGTDVWKTIDPIGAAMVGRGPGATAAGWAAAGIRPGFLDSWGSGFVTGRYPGTAWNTTGPNLTRYTPGLPRGRVSEGPARTITAAPFATAVEHLDVDAAVIQVNVTPGTSGRITLGGGADAILGSGPYCTITDCACPAGSPGAGTTFGKMSSGEQYVALTGGDRAGSATLVGQSLADFCAKPGRSCLIGQWTSTEVEVRTGSLVERGGAGVRLHVDPTGHVTLTFDGMAPVTFTRQSGSQEFAGQFTYAGTLTSTITLPATISGSGNWPEAQPADASRITVTVHLSKPVTVDLEPINLAGLAGSFAGAGSVVGGQPVLSGGWTCSGDTLVTTAPANSAVSGSWTFKRTGPG
jgi:hypothetical protein